MYFSINYTLVSIAGFVSFKYLLTVANNKGILVLGNLLKQLKTTLKTDRMKAPLQIMKTREITFHQMVFRILFCLSVIVAFWIYVTPARGEESQTQQNTNSVKADAESSLPWPLREIKDLPHNQAYEVKHVWHSRGIQYIIMYPVKIDLNPNGGYQSIGTPGESICCKLDKPMYAEFDTGAGNFVISYEEKGKKDLWIYDPRSDKRLREKLQESLPPPDKPPVKPPVKGPQKRAPVSTGPQALT